MSTSANVIEYRIWKENEVVGSHTQNVMCSRCNDGLEKFQPPEDFKIEAWGYDEEEEEWGDGKTENLRTWIKNNPPEYTHRQFQPTEKVKLNKRRGEAEILETFRGKFGMPYYIVKTLNGDILEEVKQNEVLPLN